MPAMMTPPQTIAAAHPASAMALSPNPQAAAPSAVTTKMAAAPEKPKAEPAKPDPSPAEAAARPQIAATKAGYLFRCRPRQPRRLQRRRARRCCAKATGSVCSGAWPRGRRRMPPKRPSSALLVEGQMTCKTTVFDGQRLTMSTEEQKAAGINSSAKQQGGGEVA